MAVLLKRFDPEENDNRWYMVHVQPTLFEPIAVICAWGSWETAWQRMRILPADSLEEAQAAADEIVATKLCQQRVKKSAFQRIKMSPNRR